MSPRSSTAIPKQELAERYRTGNVSYADLAAQYGVSRQRIHQVILQHDPHAIKEGKEKQRIQAEQLKAVQKQERQRRLATPIGTCRVCYDPIYRQSSRRRAIQSCSTRCSDLWAVVRYHMDEGVRQQQTRAIARWALQHPDRVSPWQLRYAKKIINNEPIASTGRWIISDRVKEAIAEVNRLRAQTKESKNENPQDVC